MVSFILVLASRCCRLAWPGLSPFLVLMWTGLCCGSTSVLCPILVHISANENYDLSQSGLLADDPPMSVGSVGGGILIISFHAEVWSDRMVRDFEQIRSYKDDFIFTLMSWPLIWVHLIVCKLYFKKIIKCVCENLWTLILAITREGLQFVKLSNDCSRVWHDGLVG